MTYAAFEASVEGSQPVELYRIELGAETFEYTSSEDDIVSAAITYRAESIKRSKLGEGIEDRAATLNVEFPASNVFVRKYISVVPGQRAKLTVSRFQRGDTPTPEVIVIFVGYVRSVTFTEQGQKATVAAMPISASASRPIPRFNYQSLCNHVLYDPNGCKVSSVNPTWRLAGATVSGVSGNTIDVLGADAYPDGWFTGGFVEALGGADARMVLDHVGTTLTLLLPFPFEALGQLVSVHAGCDHTPETCDEKFFTDEDLLSNLINYGGFAFVPTKNIFESGID